MRAFTPVDEHHALPSDLLVRSPLALQQVEARLFILALGCLHQDVQRLAFEITFDDVLRDGDADGRYARLEEAQKRLVQLLKYETMRLGKRYSQYVPLFTEMSIDQDTELVTGVFNLHLKAYLLDLGSKLTTAELKSLLTMRL
ncbi:MAG TPA: RepB family plasmid replication initiator protein [Hymenobacter sp.]|jgi:hypothetical protein